MNPPLRIGMVTHYMPPHVGGIEQVAETLFAAYREAGCAVRWVASRVPTAAQRRDGERIRVRAWNGLERFGIPWPVWGWKGARELERLVAWADVVHVHDCLYLGSALASLFARQARKPVLLTQHIGFARYPSALVNGIERLAYRTLGRAVLAGASHVAFATPASAEFVTELLNGRPGAASDVPNGIETGRFRPPTGAERAEARGRFGLPDSGRVVLFVGRLVEKKGAGLFVEVSRRLPAHHFFMIGEGPLQPPTLANLTWLPFVQPESMHLVYRAADAFLLPSRSEGYPVSVLEAMATGVPVIAPVGHAFARELVERQACLLAGRTEAELSEALGRLLATPDLARSIAARAREIVVEEHSRDVMVQRYLAICAALWRSSLAASGPGR